MANPLQEQLLKAGLVKKSKVAQVAREQAKARHGKAPATPSVEQLETDRLRAERAERDRAIAAERNAQARAAEQRAQARQIIQDHRVARTGEIDYRFTDGDRIKSLLVNPALRTQLASGALVIVRLDEGYELLPRASADKVHERAPEMIVLDHARMAPASADEVAEDDYYAQFKVPDDLIW